MADKIGRPRVYLPGQRPIIYPGEQADGYAEVPVDVVRLHSRTGFPLDVSEYGTVHVTPIPGFRGWWLRTRWRLFGYVPVLLVAAFLLNLLAIAALVLKLAAGVPFPQYLPTALSVIAFVLIMVSNYNRRKHARRSRQVR